MNGQRRWSTVEKLATIQHTYEADATAWHPAKPDVRLTQVGVPSALTATVGEEEVVPASKYRASSEPDEGMVTPVGREVDGR